VPWPQTYNAVRQGSTAIYGSLADGNRPNAESNRQPPPGKDGIRECKEPNLIRDIIARDMSDERRHVTLSRAHRETVVGRELIDLLTELSADGNVSRDEMERLSKLAGNRPWC
jgi:hypothetical protein